MRTAADLRGLPAPLQQTLLVGTFQLLRPGQSMDLWIDDEDVMRQWLESRMPGRCAWERTPDHAIVRRVCAAAERDGTQRLESATPA